MSMTAGVYESAINKIVNKTSLIGVIGLGYVELPLAIAIARAGFETMGFDIDHTKISLLASGTSYIDSVENNQVQRLIAEKRFHPKLDFAGLKLCDVIVVCVPTPLGKNRDPDLSFVEDTTRQVAKQLRSGQLFVLKSTSYPGTTTGLVKSILSSSGLAPGEEFFLGYSPEREDPGNLSHTTKTIPKIVSGDGPKAAALVDAFYSLVVDTVVQVSSPQVAEAVKLAENIFRAVNVALVNELKMVLSQMNIDIWEVIEAAKSKPFGYMPFYPGPGLGGHCIPIDPFYLAWAARAFDVPTRFIELAGEINSNMPKYVVERLSTALDQTSGIGLSRAKILLMGVAYKKNVSDIRESSSLKLIELIEARGAEVDYHDPHVLSIPITRDHSTLAGRKSVDLTAESAASYDAILIATDHDAIDYSCLASGAKLIVDTRNAMSYRGLVVEGLVKA